MQFSQIHWLDIKPMLILPMKADLTRLALVMASQQANLIRPSAVTLRHFHWQQCLWATTKQSSAAETLDYICVLVFSTYHDYYLVFIPQNELSLIYNTSEWANNWTLITGEIKTLLLISAMSNLHLSFWHLPVIFFFFLAVRSQLNIYYVVR